MHPAPFDILHVWDRQSARDGTEHMALDEAMLIAATVPTLRVYTWQQPEITFGYPQRWQDVIALSGSRPVTRRCTGGGIVEHGNDVTIALAVPGSIAFAQLSPVQAYEIIHEAIRRTLQAPELELAKKGNAQSECFVAPSVHDLVVGSKKVAGGAIRRSREGLLYQGSIQFIATGPKFIDRLAHALARESRPWEEPANVAAACERLRRERYGNPDWNQRR